MLKKITAALFAATIFTSCIKEDNACEYEECGVSASASETTTLQNYLTSNNITATKHCSGLFYRIENPGTGDAPEACDNVAVRYKGTYLNGSPLDQSTTPVGFNLTGVIRGWTNAVPLIKEGGRIVIYVPPTLAYGPSDYINPRTGAVMVPGNSYLIFEIDLVEVL
jgi:FKBP-type peptidyl-prolyl cis-trans isomerase FkpA